MGGRCHRPLHLRPSTRRAGAATDVKCTGRPARSHLSPRSGTLCPVPLASPPLWMGLEVAGAVGQVSAGHQEQLGRASPFGPCPAGPQLPVLEGPPLPGVHEGAGPPGLGLGLRPQHSG